MCFRSFLAFCLAAFLHSNVVAQQDNCVFRAPFFTLHFGHGSVPDVNLVLPAQYDRLSTSCPPDGYYAYASATADCFSGDWHNLTEDHTPGDAQGNMLLVNSAYEGGLFLSTRVAGFKGGRTYRFGAWLMNLCRPTRKCPFPLLPNLTIRLQTPAGKTVATFATGEIQRVEQPQWVQHQAVFTVPAGETELLLSLVNNAPGGCGNDFVLDDISFSECVKPEPPKPLRINTNAPPSAQRSPAPAPQPVVKKKEVKPTPPKPVASSPTPSRSNARITIEKEAPLPRAMQKVTAVPLVLRQRTATLFKRIEAEAGEIKLELFDNGEIDGDTVSIYHNNALLLADQRLSQKAVTIRLQVSPDQPHHEVVMVAKNLGSIPPNTSLMIVTTKEGRSQVFISSTEQQNAKIVVDLKR